MIRTQRLFIGIILLFPLVASAQLSIGVQGGVGAMRAWNQEGYVIDYGFASRVGGTIEATIGYEISPSFGLVSGVGWRQRGAGAEIAVTDNLGAPIGMDNIILVIDYLTLPLMMRFHTEGDVRFVAQAGPYFDFWLRSAQVSSFGTFFSPNPNGLSLDDAGISLSLGSEVQITRSLHWVILLREDIGFMNETQSRRGLSWATTQLITGLAYTFSNQ